MDRQTHPVKVAAKRFRIMNDEENRPLESWGVAHVRFGEGEIKKCPEPFSSPETSYTVEIGSQSFFHKRKYATNNIWTAKYTWYNFLPKNLFFQFTKLMNVYFLIIMILQTIQVISISRG